MGLSQGGVYLWFFSQSWAHLFVKNILCSFMVHRSILCTSLLFMECFTYVACLFFVTPRAVFTQLPVTLMTWPLANCL